jgi:hypothetical protein
MCKCIVDNVFLFIGLLVCFIGVGIGILGLRCMLYGDDPCGSIDVTVTVVIVSILTIISGMVIFFGPKKKEEEVKEEMIQA